jgi:3-deoxy-D-manno-octulosonic acid kinase
MARHIAADRYLWPGLKRTRPWRELAVLAHLAAAGLAVPMPVGARVSRSRSGLIYRGDLITGYLADAPTVSSLLGAGALLPAHWQRMGTAIAQFHRAGVDHADLNAHNILIDASDRVHLIDFDRARLRRPGRWRERNLARLRRSLDKLAAGGSGRFAEADWQRLLAAYWRA